MGASRFARWTGAGAGAAVGAGAEVMRGCEGTALMEVGMGVVAELRGKSVVEARAGVAVRPPDPLHAVGRWTWQSLSHH